MGFIPAAVLRGTSHGEQFLMLFLAGNRHVSNKESSFGAVQKSVCPALVCFSFAVSQSHCQHSTASLIHSTVCPVSTVFLALSTFVCPSLGSGHFSDTGLPLGVTTAISLYTDHLRSSSAVCTVLAFIRAMWGWQSRAATHSPTPSGIQKFWIQGLQFSVPGPGLQVPGSSVSAF